MTGSVTVVRGPTNPNHLPTRQPALLPLAFHGRVGRSHATAVVPLVAAQSLRATVHDAVNDAVRNFFRGRCSIRWENRILIGCLSIGKCSGQPRSDGGGS